ncbi:MAG: hydroxymethylbilane synthase [Nitrospirae bacterium]|nr:hydroxymethylbilane synthase [Nitrospirota bacterium]
MKKNRVRIGTRGSALALWQANHVAGLLRGAYAELEVEIVTIKTTGDNILDSPLAQVGGKGLFVKEIEEALLSGEVDLAVHSLKDVPAFFPDGLGLAAVLPREDPRDALLARNAASLDDLPRGARVGTSSLRRQAQLLHLRPDLEIVTLRGNVDTRVRKLDSGDYDAIVLAAAGLKRMGLAGHVSAFLGIETLLPAVGQGAIGIETRLNDPETNGLVSSLEDNVTRTAVSAERAFLRRLEGGCQVPIAAHAVVSGGSLKIAGLVASLDGRTLIRNVMEGVAAGPEDLGVTLAERILSAGGREVLDAVYQAAGPGRTRVVPSPVAGDSHTKIPSPLTGEQGGGV